jgi:hypothetical protein
MKVKISVSDYPDTVTLKAPEEEHKGVYNNHEDAMTVAWLLRDLLIEAGDSVNLIYNW